MQKFTKLKSNSRIHQKGYPPQPSWLLRNGWMDGWVYIFIFIGMFIDIFAYIYTNINEVT